MKRLILDFRRLKQVLIVSILIFMCSGLANAAMISGSIYDLALQKESDVIVEINTVPKQLFVSKIGDYTFNIKPGNYTLYAHTSTAKATESVIIDDDDNYTLDIILEDTIVELPKDTLLTDSGINVSSNDILDTIKNTNIKNTNAMNNTKLLIIGFVLVFALALIILYMLIRTKKTKSKSYSKDVGHNHKQDADHNIAMSESSRHDIVDATKDVFTKSEAQLDEYASMVLQIIKKEKRTTQKDLRKEVPLSEAKISLIISDLEDKGKVRKIRKGRGNILIFVKD